MRHSERNSSSFLNEEDNKREQLEDSIAEELTKANSIALKINPLPALYAPI